MGFFTFFGRTRRLVVAAARRFFSFGFAGRWARRPRPVGAVGVSLAAAVLVAIGVALGASVSGSNFEIDSDANLVVDGQSPSIDWLEDGTNSAMRADVTVQADTPSGKNDSAFGQGSNEDQAVPTFKPGSVPPNKSDLTNFGVFEEQNANGSFLHLFWTRVQEPSGTTNMDFELNQKQCPEDGGPDCSSNGHTPERTAGDALIEYHLDNGGTVATVSLREWTGSAWGPEQELSGQAIGDINDSAITAAAAGGLGSLSPRTFGETSIDLDAILPPDDCFGFGSAFLKSRSSDSFQAEIKDFIDPVPVTISNCGSVTVKKTDDAGNLVGGVSFTLWEDTDPTDGDTEHDTGEDVEQTDLTCTTDADTGECTIANVPFGEYWVVEDSGVAADQHVSVTFDDPDQGPLTFVNPRTHKVIVLVCHEGTPTLAASDVDDVTGGGSDPTTTLAEGATLPDGVSEEDLCSLGGAAYTGKSHDLRSLTVDVGSDAHP